MTALSFQYKVVFMTVAGTVIRGDGYGRKIGFPTVNIDRDEYQKKEISIEYGVYAGFVTLSSDNTTHRAGIVIGPEDAWGLPKLEAHLIDFSEDVYGEHVTFHILAFIRPFQHYAVEAALQDDIQKDITIIKNMDLCLPE